MSYRKNWIPRMTMLDFYQSLDHCPFCWPILAPLGPKGPSDAAKDCISLQELELLVDILIYLFNLDCKF